MKLKPVTVLAVILAWVAPICVRAQVCSLEDTLPECKAKAEQEAERLRARFPDSGTQVEQAAQRTSFALELLDSVAGHLSDQQRAAEADLQTKNTGVSPASSAGGANTVNDFVSPLKVSAGSGGVSEGEEDLALELNQFLGLPTNAGYKLDATVRKAELFEPLESLLTDAGESALLSDFENELGDADDVTLGFTYSPMTERLGRSDHQLHAAMFQNLFTASEAAVQRARANAGIAPQTLMPRLTRFEDGLNDAIESKAAETPSACPMKPTDESKGFTEDPTLTFRGVARCLNDEPRAQEYLALYEAAWLDEMGSLYTLQHELAKNQFFRFADLVANQPQVYARAIVHSRDELVGPSETAVSLTYEKGWVNVNSFRDYQEANCSVAAVEAYQCLTEYLTGDRLATLDRGDRFAVTLKYVKTDDYRFQPRADLPVVAVDSAHSLVAGVGYGHYLQFAARGQPQSRLDVGLSYEDVSDDETRQNRGLFNVTYSQRVSDSFVLAVSAVYANKPEFRGTVDEEISLNFGLNYKLLRASEF